MSTHNMFSWRNKKNDQKFFVEKSALYGAVVSFLGIAFSFYFFPIVPLM